MNTCAHHGDVVSDIKEVKSDVKEILKLLKGNGSPGLCTKQAIAEDRIESLLACRNWLIGIGGTITASLIIAGVIALISKVH